LEMQRVMQRHCAVFRDGPLLNEGVEAIEHLAVSLRDGLDLADHSLFWNSDLAEALELDNMIAQARQPAFRSNSNRKPGRARARELPDARRRELAQTHPCLIGRGQPRPDRLSASPPHHAFQ
jgi:succinate dehydrogenase / fumarate reductase flavoprotein subunit